MLCAGRPMNGNEKQSDAEAFELLAKYEAMQPRLEVLSHRPASNFTGVPIILAGFCSYINQYRSSQIPF